MTNLHYDACPENPINERLYPFDRYPCACAEIDEDMRAVWLEDK